MLSESEKKAIVRSWRLVTPISETAGDLFYRRLFELEPGYASLFPDDMAAQKRKLMTMLAFIVKAMELVEDDWEADVAAEDDLALVVLAMGRRHTSLYKVPDASYDTVGEALLWTLEQGLGEAFTDEVRAAWAHLYRLVSTTMKLGGKAATVDMALGRAD